MGSFSIVHWLIVLVIVVLIFGTKKLRGIGQDLGGAVKGFRDGMREGTGNSTPESLPSADNKQTIEGEVREKTKQ